MTSMDFFEKGDRTIQMSSSLMAAPKIQGFSSSVSLTKVSGKCCQVIEQVEPWQKVGLWMSKKSGLGGRY